MSEQDNPIPAPRFRSRVRAGSPAGTPARPQPHTHFHFRLLTEDDARTMLAWRYPPPLDLYNADLAYMDENIDAVMTPEFHYYTVLDDAGQMIGFCCFGEDAQVTGGDYSRPAVDVGLSLDPALIGQGLGGPFLAAILDLGRTLFGPSPDTPAPDGPKPFLPLGGQRLLFRATVIDFNRRSRRLFEKAGFVQVQRFTSPRRPRHSFVVLELKG